MVIVVVLLALAFLAVLAAILLRRAGGGRFPWLQFYMKGRESGFIFHEINLLRRVSIEAKLENPTALFWSIKAAGPRHQGDHHHLPGAVAGAGRRSTTTCFQSFSSFASEWSSTSPSTRWASRSSRKLMPKQGLRIMLPGLGPVFLHSRGEPDTLHGHFPSPGAQAS